MNDKAYCIRSNKFIDKPCSNTDCDRHEANIPLDDSNRRQWARFECKEYSLDSELRDKEIEPIIVDDDYCCPRCLFRFGDDFMYVYDKCPNCGQMLEH